MKNIDILFINHEETRTGAPKIILNIAKEFSKTCSVAVLSFNKGPMHKEFMENFGSVIYPRRIYHFLSASKIARRLLARIKPKVVYVNTIAGHEYAKEAVRLGIKTIIHVHELESDFNKILKKEDFANFKNWADMFIAVSPPVANYLINKMGCSPPKVVVVSASISVDDVILKSENKNIADVYKELGKEGGRIIVLAAGSVCFRKGTDILARVQKALEKKSKDKFKFVWLGEEREKFPAGIFGKDFLFLGERENPYPYIKAADIFALPSREDACPLVLLEAMALGKPAVAFKNSGGAAQMLEEKGYLVENMDEESFAELILRAAENVKEPIVYDNLAKYSFEKNFLKIKKTVLKLMENELQIS